MLSIDQQLRYARHLTLPGFGVKAQQRLMDSSVLIVGAGGLGSPCALYLAAAGVGRIGIVDDDVVDLTNLQRQILHRTADVGCAKTDSACRTLTARNPGIKVVPHTTRFDETNAEALVREYDLVVDGTDNFPTRYLINDAAVLANRQVVHGSVSLYEGQVTVIDPGVGPCYRCLFPQPPPPGRVPSCAEAGVLGVLPGIIGVLQATEAIKLLTGLGKPLVGRLLSYDALSMEFRTLRVERRRDCDLCGESPSITAARAIEWHCAVGDPGVLKMNVQQLRTLRENGERHLLLDVREPQEIEAGHIDEHLNIPLSTLEARLSELSDWQDALVVCLCQVGIRSRKAADLLRRNGFTRVANAEGGYLAWLTEEQCRAGKNS